ncbi:hypothetical protein EVAR_61328_1 [Eumeta japonica]|uniref:Uncharacterized protein n=1 Tax=Eumeta variegata TaxID=151549 RepID=A0A4C1Y2C3_EUMVA|nr:hypothetical protein EVAR_61328_1 [Eumeta japonica]
MDRNIRRRAAEPIIRGDRAAPAQASSAELRLRNTSISECSGMEALKNGRIIFSQLTAEAFYTQSFFMEIKTLDLKGWFNASRRDQQVNVPPDAQSE